LSAVNDSESDVLLDVGVCLSLEVGRARITIRDLLQLGPGSVVALERPAGSPLDVFVNSRLVARGEVVMINDHYGVRFTAPVAAAEVRN
jgi:flagellar motor switch protein FliN/FliY